MAGYKDPAFQDRVASAVAAKQKALDKLRAKPPEDPAVLAEKLAARLAREAAAAEKRAADKAAREEAKALADAERAAKEPTEAERKAARDARYAARKAKKK